MTIRSAAAHAPFTVAPPAYQLPAELALGPVRLQVADVERSAQYYERVIGLQPIARSSSTITMGARGSDTVLVELHERRGAAPVPSRGRLGLYHFALLLPSRSALGSFLAHIRAIGEYAGMSDHLVSEAMYLTDPDGLGIEVYADRPRESWRMAGAAIAMATDPLNVPELLTAGADEPWRGMPPGTRIGHVHLYVGSLEQSAAFYHAALGFDRVVLNFPGALFLSAGGYHHHLGTNVWAAHAPIAKDDEARLLEWTVLLPQSGDVDAAEASLATSGYAVEREGNHVIAVDPWGTRVRIASRS
jgi:catechol 2,3-dioxygenase